MEYHLKFYHLKRNIYVDINLAENVAQFSECSFMNIRRKLQMINIMYLTLAKWPYIYHRKKRHFLYLVIIYKNTLYIVPNFYAVTLNPWFHWIGNLVLYRDITSLKIFQETVPKKQKSIPHCFTTKASRSYCHLANVSVILK